MEATPFHIGITTDNFESTMQYLGDAFGMAWTEPSGRDSTMHDVNGKPQRRPWSCISRKGPIYIDLIESQPDTIWETHETRLHHFAYWTDDLRADIDKLTGEGWTLEITRAGDDGLPTVFAYLVREDGMRIELIDSKGKEDYYARLA